MDEDSYSPIASDQDQGRGSAVASIIVYGDELHDQEIVNKKGVKLYDACASKEELRETLTEEI